MTLLQKPFRALVIGSSGTIGSALVSTLQMHSNCAEVMGIHRGSIPSIDYADPSTIATAAEALAAHRPFDLIIN
ncbi:MAG: short-chain dehydrogenase, partial [Burkholderiaceae bacterium]|nr:short-chain dehydrogenase [Burkholderiaceae bacterium]